MAVNPAKKKRALQERRTLRELGFRKDGLADVTIYGFGDLVLGDRTDNLLDHLAVLEHENRGDAADIVTARRVHRFVHVQLHDLDLTRVVVGDFRDGRGEHVTRAAPFRPKIYEYRLTLAGRKNFALKIAVSNCLDIFRHIL